MTDVINHDIGGGPYNLMEKVEEILNWAATKSIQEDPDCHVVQSYDQAFEAIGVSRSEMAGHYTEDPRGILTIDHGAAKVSHWYLWGSDAWKAQRGQFEDIKPLFEKFLDFTPDDFTQPHSLMSAAKTRLEPVEDLVSIGEDIIGDETAGEAPEVSSEFFESMTMIDEWAGISKIEQKFSEEWTGVAAQVFRTIYVRQLPAILITHTVTAALLSESLEVTKTSYDGARQTARKIANEGLFVVQNYPYHGESGESTDWVTYLNIVAGGATMIAALTAPIAGAGTAVSVVAGAVSGAATIASAALASHAEIDIELSSKKMEIDGVTVNEIISSIRTSLKTALQAVYDLEDYLSTEVSAFVELATSSQSSNIVIDPTWLEKDIHLTVWEAYFSPPAPKIASIDATTSFETISSAEYMDVAPDNGKPFASDLQNLYDVGGRYLPALSDSFSAISTQIGDAPDALDSAFKRAGGTSPLQAPWNDLYDLLMVMLTSTGDNLNEAGVALEIIADAFAAVDEEAAAHLNESLQD